MADFDYGNARIRAMKSRLLARRFTAYTYDRRGRGDSGDTRPYAREREVEDLEALIRAGKPVDMERLLPAAHRALIEAKISESGSNCTLKVLKDNLPESISYEEIRMVRAFCRR